MNLFEEYYQRHSLLCPVIKRPDSNSHLYMLYRSDPVKWRVSWVVFHISVKPENYHPSYYQFSWQRPYHNGVFAGKSFESIAKPLRVEWDDYDIEIIKVAQRGDGLNPISDLAEAKMAVWEMFLYGTDDRISGLSSVVRRKIYTSIDPVLAIEERMKAQESVQQYFRENVDSFYSRWNSMKQYYVPGGYATWYAELVHRMRDKSYRKAFSDLQSVV
jgi:hypothetical protein